MSMTGELYELPLSSLIEMTSLGSKTGILVLFESGGAEAGRLVFKEGRLVGASCGSLGPEKAFYALLALKEGRFELDTSTDVIDEQCNLPTASLLMEGMRRIDELVELRRRLPAPVHVRVLEGQAQDAIEARVLGYLGPGARAVGDIVDGVLVGADADEYDALKAILRLEARGVVGVDEGARGSAARGGGAPQPELER
jgi:hypothetical protein